MNLTTVLEIADQLPEEQAEELRERVRSVLSYPDDGTQLAEELVPILHTLVTLNGTEGYDVLLKRAWEDIFKGGAAFNRGYITSNLDPEDEQFMKYLDIAIHAANPEHSHQVGLGKQRRKP